MACTGSGPFRSECGSSDIACYLPIPFTTVRGRPKIQRASHQDFSGGASPTGGHCDSRSEHSNANEDFFMKTATVSKRAWLPLSAALVFALVSLGAYPIIAMAADIKVKLSGAEEVPAVSSPGTGTGTITIGTDMTVSGASRPRASPGRRRIYTKRQRAKTARSSSRSSRMGTPILFRPGQSSRRAVCEFQGR